MPFVTAAIALGYINARAISYVIYALLFLLFPVILLIHPVKFDKGELLRKLFYAFAAIILAGTVSDLIAFKGFAGYKFSEGDMVFVNILWNMPSIWGALFSVVIAALYVLLGKWVRRRRKITYALYISIIVVSAVTPFLYTYLTSGYLPRTAWMQKASFNILEQLLILVSLSVCVTSRSLWKKHIWK